MIIINNTNKEVTVEVDIKENKTELLPNKDQIISSFKADFAELLAKYDAEMDVKERFDGYSYYVEGIVFSIYVHGIECIEINVGASVTKDCL